MCIHVLYRMIPVKRCSSMKYSLYLHIEFSVVVCVLEEGGAKFCLSNGGEWVPEMFL